MAVSVVGDNLSFSEAASDVTSQLVTGPWTAGSVGPRADLEDTTTVTVPSLSDAADVSPASVTVVTSTDAAPKSADSAGHPEADRVCQEPALESIWVTAMVDKPCGWAVSLSVTAVSAFESNVVIDSGALPNSGVDAYVWPGLDISDVTVTSDVTVVSFDAVLGFTIFGVNSSVCIRSAAV